MLVKKYLYRTKQRHIYLSAVEKIFVLNQNLVTVHCSCVLKSKPATVVLFLIFFWAATVEVVLKLFL
jgi:hypothetical protein